MKSVFFIHANSSKQHPRAIRVRNIVKHINDLSDNININILTLEDNIQLFKKDKSFYKTNVLNIIHIIFRYLGIYKLSKLLSKDVKLLDPLVVIRHLIKIDIIMRLRHICHDVIFVVIISPFSNYVLVPWLKRNYPRARIIIDMGDPLYRNSARWNDDTYSRDIEYLAFLNADSIIVTNEWTKLHLSREYGLEMSRLYVIPQGVDTTSINNSGVKDDTIDKGTMAYAGRFYEHLRSPEALFSFIRAQDYFTLNVYGSNYSLDIPNVNFHKQMPQELLFEELRKNEILVFIDNKFGIQSSGKIYELLAFRKPILFICGDQESEPYNIAKCYPNVIFAMNTSDSIRSALFKYPSFDIKTPEYSSDKFSWKARAIDYMKVINGN